ncbi:MAG: photosynthetic reaction center cytochrome c subunit [Acidobacteriota bacterium]|nr:photosynthetic reaction center cytochrome c subunit [Acidobacteriota bacterium]
MARFRRFQTIGTISLITAAALSVAPELLAADNAADYEFFKTRVQPIFLKHRENHARCVTCHGGGSGGAFVLQVLNPGAAEWTEEQTRKNYAMASQLVAPGNPLASQLLMHPLIASAGGDSFHSGGHQFESQSDPDWQTMAEWVKQKPPAEYKNLKVLKGEHLMDAMRAFNISLGEQCTYCHTAPDFSADTRPAKQMARHMIQLTEGLSQGFGQGSVTCYTCHRGNEVPKTAHPRFPNLKFPI